MQRGYLRSGDQGMLSSDQRQTILAAIAICCLAAVAFLAAYSGQSSPAQYANGVNAKQNANNTPEPETNTRRDSQTPLDRSAAKSNVLPSRGNNEGGNDSADSKEQGTEFWPSFMGYRLKITDTLIALFTALLFFATIALWLSTRGLVRGADDTSKKQLRAYIGVQDIVLKCAGFSDQNYRPIDRSIGHIHKDFILLTIKNFGLTPAYDTRIWVNWQSTAYPQRLSDRFSYPDQGIVDENEPQVTVSQHVLHRDQSYTGIIAIYDLSPFILTKQQKTMLYIYGHIDYRDIYHRRWSATFCQSWEPWSTVGMEFVPYQEHNDEIETTPS